MIRFLMVACALMLATLLLVGLYGCATPPEPKIVTQIVKEAVPTPCSPKMAPRPALMDKPGLKAALAATTNFDDKIKILTSQVLLYMGWLPQVEAGLKGCEGNPSTGGN